jgi:ERCC4-type nuclease
MDASIEELCEVEGVGENLAEKIKTYFKEKI